ncbi:hypothetical protein PPL_03913 [Heterostelium album PN500]|uniref:Uncharacterized protein n=1 Tax=Heterostelium pallidum (strain ATCC 26659 / Pp 5 / PN500) TaxID=670386 RepID=D3B5H5_HETP5|nr:hypothetical protein PPL_03913 [Heterostelium album PN500]EFA83123.1 hypothetical protein PPL_03913 [Heterostelium album PN500]|eukprot:XP_020435240.1 hypothetical protein PPL_03913 [Heterostelium album PN500]
MTETTKLAGQFIQDFITWRETKIKAILDPIPAESTLTAEGYAALTTFKDKVDVVQATTDKYLSDLSTYHQTDLALTAINKTKPTLSADLTELLTDTKVGDMYKSYAQLALLQSLQSSKDSDAYRYKIKLDVVESELKNVTSTTLFTDQTMKLTFLSMKTTAPQFFPYILYAKNLIPKVKEYYLKLETLNKWVGEAATFQWTNKDNKEEIDQVRYNELKTKLDLLDPTLGLSNDILPLYNYALFAYFSTHNIKDSPMNRKIFQHNITRELKKINKDSTNEFYSVVSTLKANSGSLVKLSHKLSSGYFTFMNKESIAAAQLSSNHVFTVEDFRFIVKMDDLGKATQAYSMLKDNAVFYKFANGLLFSCQLAAIAYGFMNYDKLTTFDKSLLYTGTALSVVDVATSVVGKKIFYYMAQEIKDILRHYSNTAISKTITAVFKGLPKIITKSFMGIASKLMPVFLLISIGFSLYDAITSAKEGNWGIFVLSLLEVAAAVGYGLCLIFATTCWAGPLSLILGGALIVLALVKVLWGFLATLFTGDPVLKYINSVDAKYVYTEKEEFKLNWEAKHGAGSSDSGEYRVAYMHVFDLEGYMKKFVVNMNLNIDISLNQIQSLECKKNKLNKKI